MNTAMTSSDESTLAATVAGEDLACGDYVAKLNETYELPSFLWDRSDFALPPQEPVRLKYLADDAGQPLKVIGICLPFVYVLTPRRQTVTIDLRRTQIVRLDAGCAKRVWREMKGCASKPCRFD